MREDLDCYGSIAGVPEDKRFVAFYHHFGGEPEWCRVADGGRHWKLDWIASIRKVDLS
jgi:hypothetical protein